MCIQESAAIEIGRTGSSSSLAGARGRLLGVVTIGRKGGYDEWLTPDGLLQIQGWARHGLTNSQIANNIGIAERTITEWIARFPAISAAIKKGRSPVDIEVENALLKRALGYEYTETVTDEVGEGDKKKTHTRTLVKHCPPDVGAICFWLKNRRPDKWRDRVQQEVSVDVEDLSPLVELLK